MKYILNYRLTRLDTLHEITSNNIVPRDAPSSDETPPPPQTIPEQKFKESILQLIASAASNDDDMGLSTASKKDISMMIAQKRNPPVLFHLRELLLVPQSVGRMARGDLSKISTFCSNAAKARTRGAGQGDKSPSRAP